MANPAAIYGWEGVRFARMGNETGNSMMDDKLVCGFWRETAR